jgi:hypothetical protein
MKIQRYSGVGHLYTELDMRYKFEKCDKAKGLRLKQLIG